MDPIDLDQSIKQPIKQIKVGKIELNDLIEIERIGKACLPLYYHAMDLLVMLFNPKHLLLKIYDDQKIYGLVAADFKDNQKRLHLMSLAVLPEFRRNGYATQLLNRLKEEKVDKLSLYVVEDNYEAIKFYAKQGFKSIKRIENYYSSLNKSGYYLVCDVKNENDKN